MTDPLVQAVDARFEQVDTVVGSRIVRWIEDSGLELHELRVLLALAENGRPMTASEVQHRSGLQLDSVYQAIHALHGRGLTDEDSRRHELSAKGRALIRTFTEARRQGVEAYIAQLGAKERQLLERVLRHAG